MANNSKSKAVFYVDAIGDVTCAISFLSCIEESYEVLLRLNDLPHWLRRHEIPPAIEQEFNRIEILPSERLSIEVVECSSPGFWETLGSLNPLKFIIDLIGAMLRWKEKPK
jgi:hypothetical protein